MNKNNNFDNYNKYDDIDKNNNFDNYNKYDDIDIDNNFDEDNENNDMDEYDYEYIEIKNIDNIKKFYYNDNKCYYNIKYYYKDYYIKDEDDYIDDDYENIKEQLNKILDKYKFLYYYNDNDFIIKYNNYYADLNEKINYDKLFTFKNIVLQFNKNFNIYDITKTIKEKLKFFENYIINNIYFLDIFKILEILNDNEFIIIFSYKPFNSKEYNNEYYEIIKNILNYICDINNYKYQYQINNKYINYFSNFKILNQKYIIENYNYNNIVNNIKNFIKCFDDKIIYEGIDIYIYENLFDFYVKKIYFYYNYNLVDLIIDAVSVINFKNNPIKMNIIYFKNNVICFKNEYFKKIFENYLIKFKEYNEKNNLSLIDFKLKVLKNEINLEK